MGKTVGVVGGGAAGLAACRCLLEGGHLPVVFEACSAGVGGIWQGTKAWKPVIYDGLVTNLPHVVTQFHDLPFDPKYAPKSYVTSEQMGCYFVDYAETYGLMKHVRLGAHVIKIRRNAADTLWTVTWVTDGQEHSQDFDAIVVANGHYSVPHTPVIKGIAEWSLHSDEVTISHAADYRNPTPYRGRVVMIVGARASGSDLALQISQVSKLVYILDPLCKHIEQRGNRIRLPALNEGITREGFPILSNGIVVRKEPVTDVIFATGYKYSFPFLDLPSLGMQVTQDGKFVTGLLKHMFPRSYPDSLFFLGLPMVVAPFPLVEPQARLVSAILSGTADLEGIDEGVVTSHTLGGLQWDYVKDMLRRARVPNLDKSERRIDVVEQMYNHRVAHTPTFPGDPDTYRRIEYTVDWGTGRWSAMHPRL